MLYLGNVLLRYVLIYNLEVSFLIFQLSHTLSTIKWVIKNCFFLTRAIFFELLISNSNSR